MRLKLILPFVLFFICLKGKSQNPNDGNHEQWEYALESTGDVLQMALPLGALTTTIVKKDYQGTKKFLFSYATAMAITHSLKKTVHKQRPEGRHLYDSFPSGHTSSAFAGAAFIQRRYGWEYGKWTYLLATIVAVSRMEGPDGWHDIYDVTAGALIGIGSTYLFTKPYENSNKVSFQFNKSKDGLFLLLTYNF